MRITLPVGESIVAADLPSDTVILHPEENNYPAPDADALLGEALENPVASRRLSEFIDGESVAVLVSDVTRPTPTEKLLQHLLPELERCEAKPVIVFALGLHRSMSEAEKQRILGRYYHKRHVEHDVSNCTYLGTTTQGTPVEIFSKVAECERIICTGNIEFHYYAGYTGGAKALLPGVSSRDSIIRNHSLMLDESSHAGNLRGAVRRDIDEAGRIAGVDFIFDVVLDSRGNIVHAVAGDPVKAHREGCSVVDDMYKITVEPADIVVVSAGGMPKDINLFQAHKALENVKSAVRDGGTIILVAACREGYGNAVFEQWLCECSKPQDAIARFQKDFVMGGHKAALIGKLALEKQLYLVSDNGKSFAEKAYFKHASSLQDAFEKAVKNYQDPRVLVVPYGNATLLATK
jgi:nickel-dependent lactate racemase